MTEPYAKNEQGGWVIPAGSVVAPNQKIPDFSEIGNGNTFGKWNTFGNGNTFGDGTTFGNWTKIERVPNAKLMCISNADGSGRQVQIITNGVDTIIRAGCFSGTVDEFVARAVAENKPIYAAAIPALVAVMIAEITK